MPAPDEFGRNEPLNSSWHLHICGLFAPGLAQAAFGFPGSKEDNLNDLEMRIPQIRGLRMGCVVRGQAGGSSPRQAACRCKRWELLS